MTSKWKKLLGLFLSVCLVFSLAGCNKEEEQSDSLEDSSDVSETEEEESVYHKVGYIFSGKVDNDGFTAEMNDQRIKASNRSGVDTCYIDGVSVQDFETAVKYLVEAGCTDIVAASANYVNILDSISGKYMNINFIGYGVTSGNSNVTAYTETSYQGAYIGGMVAAYNSNSRKIGFVADTELLYAVQTANAAALGAQLVYSNPTVYAAAATHDTEIAKAVDDLIALGCDVIISYTESSYTESYCQSKGVEFIGNHDFTGRESDYSKMLMYYYPKRDSFFLAQFKQMKMDTWEPIYYTGNIGNSIINVSAALPAAKNDTDRIMKELTSKVSSNQAYIFEGELTDSNGSVRYMQNEQMSEYQIYQMDWYVWGVEVIGNYRVPQTSIPQNSFEIKE